MSFKEKLDYKIIKFPMMIIIFIAGVLHLYIYSIPRELTFFNTYNLFDSSPLFDFSIRDDCQNKSKIIFHKWSGIKTYSHSKRIQMSETNITKINGYNFCYKHISYKDLLYNGQIIKQGTECPKEYNKNCGRIDTLNQELCIKENEKCPLYDIGIGLPPDDTNYIYNNNSNVYYNKDNYNVPNKIIIGRLILNDGQPCYNSTEKLWKSFSYSEVDETHLNCTIKVFDKNNDDRFLEKGNITYKKLYEDNLDEKLRKEIIVRMKGNESVYLYKREFYGLEKKCSKNYYLNEIVHSYQKIQIIVNYFELFGSIIIMIIIFAFILIEILVCVLKEGKFSGFILCLYISSLVLFCTSFVFYTIGFIRIIQNNYLDFNCSDKITNEIIRKGQEIDNIKLELKCNYIDFFSDLFSIFYMLIVFITCVTLVIKDKGSKTPGEDLNKENTPCEKNEYNTPYENDKLIGVETPGEHPDENYKNTEKSEEGVKIPLNSCYKEKKPIN